jgi:hypothetical protein
MPGPCDDSTIAHKGGRGGIPHSLSGSSRAALCAGTFQVGVLAPTSTHSAFTLSADECCFKLNFLFRLATVSEVSKADKKSSTIFKSSGRHGSRFAIFSIQTYLIIP